MGISDRGDWRWFQRWRAVLFLVGGGAGIVSTVLFGLNLDEGVVLFGVWALAQTAQYMVPVVGLVGLYPQLRVRTPWLARVGLALAGVVITLLVVNLVALGVIGHDRPLIIVLVLIVAILAAFLVFGAASLYNRVPSRLIGLLLVMVVVESFVFSGLLLTPPWSRVGPTAANAVVVVTLLAIGYLLHPRESPSEGPPPPADAKP